MTEQDPEEAGRKIERDKLDREKMEALGYKPDSPSQWSEFQRLQGKADAGRITQVELRREMDSVVYQERDEETRGAAKQKVDEYDRGRQPLESEQKPEWKALKDREQLQRPENAADHNQESSQQIEQSANWKALQKNPELREAQEQFREQQSQMLQKQGGNIPPGPVRT